jgi:hypothetical protein
MHDPSWTAGEEGQSGDTWPCPSLRPAQSAVSPPRKGLGDGGPPYNATFNLRMVRDEPGCPLTLLGKDAKLLAKALARLLQKPV